MSSSEACIGFLGIQDICHFISMDMGYCLQYLCLPSRL